MKEADYFEDTKSEQTVEDKPERHLRLNEPYGLNFKEVKPLCRNGINECKTKVISIKKSNNLLDFFYAVFSLIFSCLKIPVKLIILLINKTIKLLNDYNKMLDDEARGDDIDAFK